ncbi:S1 family peptidase [Actinomadura sp. HBU206391]|uniref:S1 family peptidase n=1 Tax=Actinomadura sp. HBU206391 TaxID=2731692 RepID=UPI00164FFA89|nr:S1 family peptidase [Actinomadura sp. HBU206391]MBC6461254.1 S1 family peptidase [Actinomadura sp. HBU206391]
MRFVLFITVLAAAVMGVAAPSWAITNGYADHGAHPQVGALLSDQPNDDGTWAFCTGTLISPTVLLTAAHCGPDLKTARVSFSSHYEPGDKVYTGRYVADDRYDAESHLHDIAVVIFSRAVPNIRPARLPSAGMLDRLNTGGDLKTSEFTPVGFGAVNSGDGTDGTDGAQLTYTDTRHRTSISFKALGKVWLELTPDASSGEGGTCYGDSGGPNFLGGSASDLLVATTISGADDACAATNFDYRLDTAPARGFIGRFVTLP